MVDTPDLTVVIPSRDRPELLVACIGRVLKSVDYSGLRAEIVVVDDGSEPPVTRHPDARVRIVRGGGEGPARARNRGIESARGPVVAFTDDDAAVSEQWIGELMAALGDAPHAVGARGPVRSPAYDPLYEHSVEDRDAGRFLTCNVAYRLDALRKVGGFDPSLRHAHEDIDLGLRIGELGEVIVVPTMVVVHPGRPFSAREWDRRSRFIRDDWLFFRRYPDQLKERRHVSTAPLTTAAKSWLRFLRDGHPPVHSLRRLGRWVRLSVGQVGSISVRTVREYRRHSQRPVAARSGLRSEGIRIAYVGPVPSRRIGGAPGVAGSIIDYLAAHGCSIDCYVPTSAEFEATDDIAEIEGVRVIEGRSRFRFGRWYSNHKLTKMVSYQAFAAVSRVRLAGALRAEHEMAPYDVVYQFSSMESFGVPRRGSDRPPLVMHPSVHAAGELRWLKRERRLGSRCGGWARATAVRAWMALRARRQRADARRADRILALSSVFGQHLVDDYGVDPVRIAVVPNVIDLELFDVNDAPPLQPATILVLGRVVVRKGIEDIVALSHRLTDLGGDVQIRVIGGGSLWSDYRPLLADLAPEVGVVGGAASRAEVVEILAGSRLLIQASHYEPFGLTVGEALASGIPVIATIEVGAAEGVDPEVCTVVPVSDVDALEAAVRAELARGRLDDERRRRCRAEAERLFSKQVVGAETLRQLRDVAEG